MKTYKIKKNIKKAQDISTDKSKEIYTIRSMFEDLSKWEDFIKLMENKQ